jgi:putative DNA primase/helicase
MLRKFFYPSIPHENILSELLKELKEINFRIIAGLKEGEAIQRKHYLVFVIDHIMKIAKKNGWKLCRQHGQAYLFNGAYWKSIDRELLQDFFGKAAAKLGVPYADSRFYTFRRDLILQFESDIILVPPMSRTDITMINLLNGTGELV